MSIKGSTIGNSYTITNFNIRHDKRIISNIDIIPNLYLSKCIVIRINISYGLYSTMSENSNTIGNLAIIANGYKIRLRGPSVFIWCKAVLSYFYTNKTSIITCGE